MFLLALAPLLLTSPQTIELAELSSPSSQPGGFGSVLDEDGGTLVVTAGSDPPPISGNAPGAVHVFVGGGASWAHQAILQVAFTTTGPGYLGVSAAVDEDTVAVGAQTGLSLSGALSGAVAVFTRQGTSWSLQAWLQPPAGLTGNAFGRDVALSGDRLAISVSPVTGPVIDSVYIFDRVAGIWSQSAVLAKPGTDFGRSVALQGDRLVVGEPSGDTTVPASGAVNVFDLVGGAWVLQARLAASAPVIGAGLGSTVEFQDDLLVAGAFYAFPPTLHVFREGSGGWVEEAVLTPPAGLGFNGSMSLEAEALLVGDHLNDLAHLFRRAGGAWIQESSFAASTTQAGDGFGRAVSLAAGLALVSAPQADPIGGPLDAGVVHVARPCAITERYCAAGATASGCSASIASAGNPSASQPAGFVVSVSGAEGGRRGLFFFGTNGRQAAPWGNGTSFQCVAPPVVRTGLLAKAGTPGQCNGTYARDLNASWCPTCPKAAANPGPGGLAQVQAWFRDPQSTSNQTTSLSDALELTICP